MENGIRPPIQMAVDSMRSLRLGNQGEQNAQLIRIDVSKWLEKWPGAGIYLMLALPGEKASYPAKTLLQDGELLFLPGFGDTQKAGHGAAYVVATLNGTHVAVSETVFTEILPCGKSGDTLPEAPEAQAGWVAEVLNAATRAEEAAKRAENAGSGTITDEQIKEAVDDYLTENPIEVPVEGMKDLYEVTLQEDVSNVRIVFDDYIKNLAVYVYPPEDINKAMYIYIYSDDVFPIETADKDGEEMITANMVLSPTDAKDEGYTTRFAAIIKADSSPIFVLYNKCLPHHGSAGWTFLNKQFKCKNPKGIKNISVRSLVSGHELLKGTRIKVVGSE